MSKNLQIPAELSSLKPFIQRGAELKEHEPIITYYCHYYAVQQAISLKERSKEANAFLFKLMDELEIMKKELAGNECITNDQVGYPYCENFALKIFMKADNEDRSGHATRKTAMTFLASSIFLQMLRVFANQPAETVQDIEEKIRYSKWKAADIVKAIREGKSPTAGPPLDHHDNDHDNNNQEKKEDETPGEPAQKQPNEPAVSVKVTAQTPLVHTNHDEISEGLLYDPHVLEQAQKHSRYAISALQYEDLKTAVENLEKALQILRPLQQTRLK